MRNATVESLKKALARPFDLKPRYRKGQEQYQRMWMTIEVLDPFGNLQARNQWRGDLHRVVRDLDASGRAREKVTWKSVGVRDWLLSAGRYKPHRTVPFAEGFTYDFSVEDDYSELDWDYSAIPRILLGRFFRVAFSVSAHLEFDFLRSSRHASIERLRHPGELLTDPPEGGKTFDLDFPPLFTDSRLERRHIQVGFLGLTLLDDAVCALVDCKQGPQDFFWNELVQSPGTEAGDQRFAVNLKSWQEGVFSSRIEDGSLVQGELTEWHMIKRVPAAGGEPVAEHSRGIWSIREISAGDYAAGLEGWSDEQTPTPRFRPTVAPG